MTTVLAIDQGTSGTKALVVGPDDRVLGRAEVELRPAYLPGGGVEQEPDQVLRSVLHTGRAAMAQADVPVDIVSLANQGETVLAWDPDTGDALSTMIVWQDRRAASVCRDLTGHRELFSARTGLVLDPYFSAPKQAWLRRHVTREGVVTTSDTWLLHRLTSEFVTDAATASRSLVTNLDTLQWEPELLDLFGLGLELLPCILDCDRIAGETGAFGAAAAVGGLVVDQQAALLAQGCIEAGDVKCTFGTGAFVLANTGAMPTRSSAGLTTSAAWKQRGRHAYCVDGQVYAAASAVRWLQQLGLVRDRANLDRVAAPDSAGVMSVPALAGLAAPWWRPAATATLTGMTLSTERGHIVRAVLEGIAAQVAELGRCIAADTGRPLQRLRVDGGLTRSRVLMQAVADVLQAEIEVYPSPHATPLGAVALARMAMEPRLSLADALVAWEPRASYVPEWSADRAADFRSRWMAALEDSLKEEEGA